MKKTITTIISLVVLTLQLSACVLNDSDVAYIENGHTKEYCLHGDSNELYVISLDVDMSDCEFESDTLPALALSIRNTEDYNRKFTETTVSYSNYIEHCHGKYTLKRVAKTDSNGLLRFGVRLGSLDNNVIGTGKITRVKIIPVIEDSDYSLITSQDGSIRMVFKDADIKKTGISPDYLKDLAELYSGFRKDLLWLVGTEPYDGITDYVLTETFDYYGLAGNPIYINEQSVEQDLNDLVLSDNASDSNVLWGYVHEMSHTFDGIESNNINGIWNFDKEFFATLKAVYVLGHNGYGMGYDEYSGDKILDHFKSSDTLKNGVYSSDGFLYSLMSLLYEHDNYAWNHIHKVFIRLNNMEAESLTDSEKFALFIDTLSDELGCSVKSLFSDKEWLALSQEYEMD